MGILLYCILHLLLTFCPIFVSEHIAFSLAHFSPIFDKLAVSSDNSYLVSTFLFNIPLTQSGNKQMILKSVMLSTNPINSSFKFIIYEIKTITNPYVFLLHDQVVPIIQLIFVDLTSPIRLHIDLFAQLIK
jgi:hypothetical protein